MLEKLKQDMIESMKNKDKERLSVIRGIKAATDKEHLSQQEHSLI